MSKVVRGGAALRLNDFSLIYSPFAAGVCIALTPTLGRTKEPPIEEQTIGLFGFSGNKKFITLISIKLYSSYCREVWGSSIKQQFLQGSEVRMREASNRYYRKRIVKRATEQKLVVSQHTTATAEAAAVRPRTKNYHQKKNTTTTTTNRRRNCSRKRSGGGYCIRWRTKE